MRLLDINVWIGLAFDKHVNHPKSRAWFDNLPNPTPCYFCRYSKMGFMRLSTNPKINPIQTQTMSQAWAVYDQLLLHPDIGYLDEPHGVDALWRSFTQGRTYSHNVWNDAYLATFAISAGLEVVTFDQGFTQFPGLKYTILT